MKRNIRKRITAGLYGIIFASQMMILNASASAVLLGDVTADGSISIDDAAMILDIYAQTAAGFPSGIEFGSELFFSGDIDGDGVWSIQDAAYVFDYYARSAADLSPTWMEILTGVDETPQTPAVPDEPDEPAEMTAPVVELAVLNEAAEIRWQPQKVVSGYEIYRSEGWYSSGYEKIAEIADASASSYRDSGLNNDNTYFYKMRAYQLSADGSRIYSEESEEFCTADENCILNAANPLVSRRSYTCYNVQGKTTTTSVCTLSDADVAILEQFAKEHFTDEMSQAEKLYTTLVWLNRNVTYATTTAHWTQISGKSAVQAAFQLKIGQCAQYNGAMTAMMAYMGYDASLIQGWRGNWSAGSYWSHFWCEVNLGGRLYIMETGNYGQDGNWSYFLAPYNYTRKYIKNCVNVS